MKVMNLPTLLSYAFTIYGLAVYYGPSRALINVYHNSKCTRKYQQRNYDRSQDPRAKFCRLLVKAAVYTKENVESTVYY